jgi:methionyl-tRNA formyltransferase
MKNKIVFMGTPEFSVPSLEALINNNYRVVAVYTQPDRRAGRGQQIRTSAAKQWALSRRLNVMQIERFTEAGAIEGLIAQEPDLIVVAAFGMILPKEVLELPKYGCLNVHPSMLPRYRGPSPVATAILEGEERTGVTIMLMDAGMDTGPILKQREVPIKNDDTTGSVDLKLSRIGAEMLIETIPLWVQGQIVPQPQDKSKATYSRMITKEDGEIEWRLSTVELWRRIRAFEPWPGCYTIWNGKRIKLVKVLPLYGKESDEPGKVISLPAGKPVKVGVKTGDGVLGLIEVQMEGKREMTAEEFVRGQRDFIGGNLL